MGVVGHRDHAEPVWEYGACKTRLGKAFSPNEGTEATSYPDMCLR